MSDEFLDKKEILLAWHLIDTSQERGATLDEFRRAIAFLYGWSCYGESDNFKKVMMAIVEHGMNKFFRKYRNKEVI